jgi:DNA-directed RNA polymerase specialized sigma24 family protein
VQAPLRGQLSLPVRRLPIEQEVAAGVQGGERAELRRLMERLADGDRAAFAPAFALLWPRLRAFAVRYAGPADGEDAAQAALLRVFSRAGEYDSGRDALTWALGIAAWECRTLRRKRERRREEPIDPHEQPDRQPDPEAALIDRDLRAAAESVLGTLRPMDVQTIAALTGGPRAVQGAAFRKRMQRAIERFRLAWRARHGSE